MESLSEIVLLVVFSRTQPKSFGQNILSSRGHGRPDVHVGSKVPLGMLLSNGLPNGTTSSTSILLRIFPVVVLLPVGQVPQYWTSWINRPFSPPDVVFARRLTAIIRINSRNLAMLKIKIKNGRKTPKSAAGGSNTTGANPQNS
ncbi:uncharacterized protein [Drosophila suzukii]|uniref:Uncharacterized protein n=1 Tax=Drosophila suzukii TaxID=28584 RepID=A0ABM4TX89_DROSZ